MCRKRIWLCKMRFRPYKEATLQNQFADWWLALSRVDHMWNGYTWSSRLHVHKWFVFTLWAKVSRSNKIAEVKRLMNTPGAWNRESVSKTKKTELFVCGRRHWWKWVWAYAIYKGRKSTFAAGSTIKVPLWNHLSTLRIVASGWSRFLVKAVLVY